MGVSRKKRLYQTVIFTIFLRYLASSSPVIYIRAPFLYNETKGTPDFTSKGIAVRETFAQSIDIREAGMKIELKQAAADDKEVLRNLLEKYNYEFSQWDLRDVNKFGLYGYDYLDCYWTEKNRWAFLIMVDGSLAGFAMVNDFPEAGESTDYSIAEFFVMYKYRLNGVGKAVARRLFDEFHGKWQIKRHPKNTASVYFWDHVISEYTGGKYRLVKSYPGIPYADGTLGDIFFFEN